MSDKTINLQLRFNRKTIIYIIIVILLGVFCFLNFRYSLISRGISYFNRASASLIVVDKDKKPIAEASIIISDQEAKTDATGYASLDKLQKGDVLVTIEKDNFTTATYSARLVKGSNDLGQFELTVAPEKTTTISGIVIDLYSKAKIDKALVTIEKSSGNSDGEGKFDVTKVPLIATKVKVTKAGYLDYESDVEIKTANDPLQIKLVPKGKVMFTSDRDGKAAIYQSNLDGSGAEKLIGNLNDQNNEEGPGSQWSSFYISPDSKYIVFLSKGDNGNGENNYLYYSNIKGENPTKVNEDKNPYRIKWLANNTVAYVTYDANKSLLKSVKFPDLETVQLNETPETASYSSFYSYDVDSSGRVVYAMSSTINGSTQKGVYIVNTNGTERRQLSDKYCSYLNFSIDKKSVYCQSYEDQSKKYVIKIEDGTVTEGFGPFDKYMGYYNNFEVSRSGKLVVYKDSRDGKTDLYMSDTDGKNEVKLTESGKVYSFTWSSKGNYIVYVTNKDGYEANVLYPASKETKSISSCDSGSIALNE
ncbi:MAG: carboxypeptidase regulatory-like domain-containing protein [Patescibacteria group bacterium]|jgi:Tol biopolymer transport system component